MNLRESERSGRSGKSPCEIAPRLMPEGCRRAHCGQGVGPRHARPKRGCAWLRSRFAPLPSAPLVSDAGGMGRGEEQGFSRSEQGTAQGEGSLTTRSGRVERPQRGLRGGACGSDRALFSISSPVERAKEVLAHPKQPEASKAAQGRKNRVSVPDGQNSVMDDMG